MNTHYYRDVLIPYAAHIASCITDIDTLTQEELIEYSGHYTKAYNTVPTKKDLTTLLIELATSEVSYVS